MTSKPISRLNIQDNNNNDDLFSRSKTLRPRSCPNFASRDPSENRNKSVSYGGRKVKQLSNIKEVRENKNWSLLDNSPQADRRGQQQRDGNFNIAPLSRHATSQQPCYSGQTNHANVSPEYTMTSPAASSSSWSSALLTRNKMAADLCFNPIHENIVMVERPPSPNRSKGDVKNIVNCPQKKHEKLNNNTIYQDNESRDLRALYCQSLCSILLPTRPNAFHHQQFHLNAKVGDEPITFCVADGHCRNGKSPIGRSQTDMQDGTFHDIHRFFVNMNGFLLPNGEFIENSHQETNRANCDDECPYELHEQTDCHMLSRCNEEIYDCSTEDEFTDFDVDSDDNLFASRPGNPVARVLECDDNDEENLVLICHEEQQNSPGKDKT